MKKVIGFVFLVGVCLVGGWQIAYALPPIPPDTTTPPPATPTASTKFAVGDRVQVAVGIGARLPVLGSLNLSSAIGTGQPNRAIGTVVGGPGYLGGAWYWNINIDDGADGWMNESGLVKLQPKFEKDDKVETLTSLRVRTTPMGVYFPGFSPFNLPLVAGVRGTIIDGPTYYKDYVWWQINWGKAYCTNVFVNCSDAIGWSAEADIPGTTAYLAKVVVTGTNPGGTTNPPVTTVVSKIVVPAGGEVWQVGTTKVISWVTPISLVVDQVKLFLENGPTPVSIGVVKNGVPDNIQGGGDYVWAIPVSVANGTYRIKAVINPTSPTPTTIYSNSFNIGTVNTTGNSSPIISGVSGPTSLTVGQSGTWIVSATDSNGDALTYSVVWGDGASGTGSALSHTYLTAGTYAAVFTVSDGKGGSASWTITVTVTGGNNNSTSTPPGSNLSIGARVSNTLLAGSIPSWAGVGFTGFTKDKGIIIAGPQSGTWQVHYDYGGDAWVPESNLQSLGTFNGNWAFTGTNILGRELNTNSGLVIDPYYTSVNYQVSLPSSMAQSSLPPAGVAAQAGSGGRWNCLNTYAANPAIGGVFWGDTLCRYERGNIAPLATLTGPATAFTGTEGTWHFTASDAEGALASYKVDWGDGIISDLIPISGASVLKDITHTYSGVGMFTIKLTVTDAGGLTGVASLGVAVTAPCSTRFQAGDRIKVINTSTELPLKVRSSPEVTVVRDANKLGSHDNDELGTIAGGPQSGSGYCWWNINYDNPPSGWSAEKVAGLYMFERVSDEGSGNNPDRGQPAYSGVITVTAPKDGDAVRPGGALAISWVPPADATQVFLYLSDTGKIKPDPVPNTGTYLWVVPTVLNGRTLDKTSFRIQVLAADSNTPMSGYSGTFSIDSSAGGSGNQAPTLGGPTGTNSIAVGTQGTWQIMGVDPEGSNLSYTVIWGDGSQNGLYSGASGGLVSITHTYGSTGQKTISVTASDGQVSSSGSLDVSVTSSGTTGNQAPTISVFSGPSSLLVGVSASWSITASDPEGASLSYTIIWGDGNTETFSGASGVSVIKMHSYSTTGYKTVQLTVTDSAGNSVSATPIRVNVTSNSVVVPPPAKFVIGDPVRVTGDYLQVRTAGSLAGLAQGSRMTGDLGTIVGGPKYSDGYVWWNVNYDTGVDGWSVQDWLEKAGSSPTANRLPGIDVFDGPTTLAPSVTGSWSVRATDPDGDAMTYRIDWGGDTYFWQNNLNPGYQYAGSLTSGISKSIGYWFRNAGTYSLVLTVTDSKGGSASKTISVTVANTSNYVALGGYAPQWNAPDLPPLHNPNGLTTWTGPDGRIWTWVASSGLWKLTFIP